MFVISKKNIIIDILIIISLIVLHLGLKSQKTNLAVCSIRDSKLVIIDAGHGGEDRRSSK